MTVTLPTPQELAGVTAIALLMILLRLAQLIPCQWCNRCAGWRFPRVKNFGAGWSILCARCHRNVRQAAKPAAIDATRAEIARRHGGRR